MLVKEYRIVLPFTVEEYQVAQLYSTVLASRNETGGGDGVEFLVNNMFENHPLLGNMYSSGQYTKKKYYLQNKVNGFLRTLLPRTAFILEEDAWNAYPYCRTIVTNEYLRNNFEIVIESHHLPGRGELENVHQLPPEKLAQREVVLIDIAAEIEDATPDEDPKLYRSERAGRGPLMPGWMHTARPVMTCYKLVTCHFNWFGIQGRVERSIQKHEQRLFTKFHRQMFCWMDLWYDMPLDEIRQMEHEAQEALRQQRRTAELRGHRVGD